MRRRDRHRILIDMLAVRVGVVGVLVALAVVFALTLATRSPTATDAHVRATASVTCVEYRPPIADYVERLAYEIDDALAALLAAPNEVVRVPARLRLAALRHEQAEIKQRIVALRRAIEKAERAKGVHTSAACLANPLAKGCN